MPKWGFASTTAEARHWGLTSGLLSPAKVVADPVHGDIYLTKLEVLIADSVPMQRLRRVRQLGTTCLVYPAATHSRFSHSLGAVRAVQDLLDAVWDQRQRPKAAAGLLDEWKLDGTLHQHFGRATVVARLGGLLHDLCHLPFGHSVEDDLKLLQPHDENEGRFSELWGQMPDVVREAVAGELYLELVPLILSKTEKSKSYEPQYPWVQDLVGNTICADLIDYLPRDHLFTGLPIALGHRFLEAFFVTSRHSPTKPQRMALMLHRDGHERIDVATELLKYLRYRYELSERALVHHAKLGADAMIGRLLEAYLDCELEGLTVAAWEQAGKPPTAVGSSATQVDEAVAWRAGEVDRDCDIRDKARTQVEDRMLRHGDDGLVEFLVSYSPEAGSSSARTVTELASRVQRRRLHKQVARCTARDVAAEDLYRAFGDREPRRELERSCAAWAGLDSDWQLILWLPPPEMRLKPANVLVSDGSSVRRFVDYERPSGQRGNEIYRAHENLWSVSVYVAPELADDPRVEHALVWLAHRMGVRWEQLSGSFSPTPDTWPEELLRRELAADWSPSELDAVMAAPPKLRRGAMDTFPARVRIYEAALRTHSTRKD